MSLDECRATDAALLRGVAAGDQDALALALAAGLERTRWHDLAGLVAAVCALTVVGALALAPLHLLPGTIIDMTSGQQRQWSAAWHLWAAVAAAAAVIAGWAAGDPWRRAAGG